MKTEQEMVAWIKDEFPGQHISWARDGATRVPDHGSVGMWEIGPCDCKRSDIHHRSERED